MGTITGQVRRAVRHAGLGLLFALLPISAGCSSGRHYAASDPLALVDPGTLSEDSALRAIRLSRSASCSVTVFEPAVGDSGLIFAHPGLLLSAISWGGGRARDGAATLVEEGYGARSVEVRRRVSDMVFRQMSGSRGTSFIGLHYSMGGTPRVIAHSVGEARRAGEARGEQLKYGLILVDPFGFRNLHREIDLDDGTIGEVFVFLASEHSYLRPAPRAPRSFLFHPKVHLLYSEDFGVKWNHFGALGALRDSEEPNGKTQRRTRELFQLTAGVILSNLDVREVEARLHLLRLRYAIEDGRKVQVDWIEGVKGLDCLL